MKRYFIQVGDIDVHVTEWGSVDKSIIFCLHGLGSTSLSFIEIAEALENDYRIVSIDAPGHGKTAAFPHSEKYEMAFLADWLDCLIKVLEIDNFYFLSHSWGSFVSLFYLNRYAEKVLGAILIDGGYQTKRRFGVSMEEEAAFQERDFEEHVDTWDEFLDVAVFGESRRTPSLLTAARDLALLEDGKYYWHARGVTGGNIIRAMHKDETEDIYEELPRSLDMVLLRATLPESREADRSLNASIFERGTGAEVKVVSGASHMLHWDDPEVVIREIKERW
ncbi:alpha/beta fold hydrolase [Halobacillus salinus]|uniref:alpha/beta fold hydrolase n=1 Tax=Halobacillus salinus TaxID=192814 RepID=UPI0009A712EE|nr:alpha/beta hydrolase [Halobacillus salinus]